MQKVMEFAEKVIGKAADTIKEASKETENPVHVKDEPVVQAERRKIPFPVNPQYKMDMQNKEKLPQQKTTATTVKKFIIEQMKAGQKPVPAETRQLEKKTAAAKAFHTCRKISPPERD